MRLRHSSSPLGSTGSSNESWPLSKDEYAEMYSPPHHNDRGEDSANRNSTEEEKDNGSEEDSWEQVYSIIGFSSSEIPSWIFFIRWLATVASLSQAVQWLSAQIA